jgi:hypothetical protein
MKNSGKQLEEKFGELTVAGTAAAFHRIPIFKDLFKQ